MKSIAILIAAPFALVLQGSFAGAQATTASGHCTGMTVTDYLSSNSFNGTSSTTFVNLTDGRLNFTTSSTGCVMITFSGPADVQADSAHYNTLHVRTLLDGNQACVPDLYDDRFSEAEAPVPLIATSITRICKNVPAGAHRVQVQFRSDDG